MLTKTRELLQSGAPLRVVCYGDSISEVGRSAHWWGGASCTAMNWGQQFGALLRAAYPQSEITVRHFGVGGQNAYEGLGRLDWLDDLQPDLVLVAFGANDCGYHFLLPEETGLALKTLAEWIGERYGADVVIVGSGGDNPREPFFQHLDETLAATRDAADAAGVPYVDIRTPILHATEDGARWSDYHNGTRNCHPNDAGHRVWAEAAFGVVQTALEVKPAEV